MENPENTQPIESAQSQPGDGGVLPPHISSKSQEDWASFTGRVDDILLEELWRREVGDRAEEKVEQFHNLFDKRLGLNKYPRMADGVNHLLQELIAGGEAPAVQSAVGEILTADYKQRRADEEAKKLQRIADTASNKLIYASAHKIDPRELAIEGAITDVETLLQAAVPLSIKSNSTATGRDRLPVVPKAWIKDWSTDIRKAA